MPEFRCSSEHKKTAQREGYGPYKPVMVGKLLAIVRVFYNFVEVGKNKQTPAIRLGLAKGKVTVETKTQRRSSI